jgi:hypothetical protein
MHFRSDKQFLKLTKILEIKNKRNFRGVCSDIPVAKMILPKNIFGLCVLKRLVNLTQFLKCYFLNQLFFEITYSSCVLKHLGAGT